MAVRVNRFYYHLGLGLTTIVPSLLMFSFTGSWLYALILLFVLNLLGLFHMNWMIALSFHVLKLIIRKGDFPAERMVIELSSIAGLKKIRGSIPPDRILILLPHCLQNHNCTHRITFDPSNCRRCGKCPVGDILQLAEKFGTPVAVATGGTLARRHVADRKPLAVVAVACPRDLSQGMLDAWPVPVIGVENSRPCGDCLDTHVDVNKLEKALKDLTG